MDKWSFNSVLFSRLSEVLEISGAEIARRCGMTQQVFSRYTTNEVVVSVQVLIRICNALRMPVRFFVSEDGRHDLPDREAATVGAGSWHPIGWDSMAVEQTFGDGRIYWKDVADAMGVSSQKPHERFLLRKRFPVDAFLATCSRLDISPFRFLIDDNLGGREQKEERHRAKAPELPSSESEAIRAELSELRKQVAALTATVAELTGKYAKLLERHNRIENAVTEYFGGGFRSIDTAAEPGPGKDRR